MNKVKQVARILILSAILSLILIVGIIAAANAQTLQINNTGNIGNMVHDLDTNIVLYNFRKINEELREISELSILKHHLHILKFELDKAAESLAIGYASALLAKQQNYIDYCKGVLDCFLSSYPNQKENFYNKLDELYEK